MQIKKTNPFRFFRQTDFLVSRMVSNPDYAIDWAQVRFSTGTNIRVMSMLKIRLLVKYITVHIYDCNDGGNLGDDDDNLNK